MRIAHFYQKTLFGMFALMGLIVASTSALYVYTIDRQLNDELQKNSRAIARSVADSNIDLIVDRNYSALQSVIDQYVEIPGISYVYVVDDHGDIIAHTFVPGVPDAITADYRGGRAVYDRVLPGMGRFTEVTAGILAGVAGSVHVGVDKGYIALQVQTAIGKQVYLLTIVFVVSILVSFGLMYQVSRPLHDLRNHAWHAFSEGDRGEPPHPSERPAPARTHRRGRRIGQDHPLGYLAGAVSMRATNATPNRWVLASMCTVLALCLGSVYAWSYFQPLLVEEFRWSNTQTSWAFSLNIFFLGLSAAWGGSTSPASDPRGWPSPVERSSPAAMRRPLPPSPSRASCSSIWATASWAASEPDWPM